MTIESNVAGIPGIPDILTRPLSNPSSQDATSALFHQTIPASHSEIRLNVGKGVELHEHLLPTRGALTSFLESLDLTVDDLKEHNIPVQALERLLTIESSFWGTVRWINIDSLVEKVLHYPALRWSDAGVDSKDHLWIEGRGLPLKNEWALRLTYGISGFRQGAEFILSRGTQLTLYAILAYQIISSAKAGTITSFSQFVSLLMSADDKAFQALFLYTQAKDIVAAALSLPVIWGIVKAFLNSQNAKLLTEQRLQEISDFFARKDISHTMRWLLPLHPVDQRINELERYLRWDGRLSLQQRVTAFNILTDLAEQSGGYTKIAVLHLLAKLAHGHALKQLVLIKETDPQLLAVKTRAFEIIQLNAAIRQKGITGFIHNTYAHYLKWTLADSDSKKITALMLAFKVSKIAIHLLILKTIAESLISYLQCPNRQGFTLVNGYPPSSYLFSETCFNEYVDQFNSFPGQPVDTLTNLIPKTNFIGNYTLNLSGKGLNGTITAQILQSLAHHAHVTALNLSGNAINTVQDVNLLWAALPTQLISLDLSSNGIGVIDSLPTQAMGNRLSSLSTLTLLNLSGNSIGNTDSNGTQAIGNSLSSLIALRSLDLSNNYLGYRNSNGTQTIGNSLSPLTALTSLDLSHNLVGYHDSLDTQAIGSSLIGLNALISLDLSGNSIGHQNSDGTQVIGNGLTALNSLTWLDLSGNPIGSHDSKGTQAIAKALPSLHYLQYIGIAPIFNGNGAQLSQVIQQLHLRNDLPIVNSPAEAEAYLAALPANTTIINLNKKLTGASVETFTTLFQGLTRFTNLKQLSFNNNFMDAVSPVSQILANSLSVLTTLTLLDLSNNAIGYTDSRGVQAIGNSLSFLTALTSLDLSSNAIGSWSGNSTQVIGNSLNSLTSLISLDLSNSEIGYWNSNGTQAIGNSLSSLTALTSLNLSGSYIGYTDSKGTQAIGNSLSTLTALTSLDLSATTIGFKDDLGVLAISRSLQKLVKLSKLDLSNNFIGSTGPEGPQVLLNVLPNLKQLESAGLAGTTNASWPDGAAAIAQITDNALNDACNGQLCFGRNLTMLHLTTSAGSRLSLPLYLRIPAQLSVWAINSLRQEIPRLSGTSKEPTSASTPRLVSVCQAAVGGAVILYLANKVKNHLLSWWNGTTEVISQEPYAPQEYFERRIRTFDGWLDSLKIAFERIHNQNRIPEYESKWYLSSVENYQDDIAKLQAKGGATRKELHELSLDIKALHKEAIAQIKAA